MTTIEEDIYKDFLNTWQDHIFNSMQNSRESFCEECLSFSQNINVLLIRKDLEEKILITPKARFRVNIKKSIFLHKPSILNLKRLKLYDNLNPKPQWIYQDPVYLDNFPISSEYLLCSECAFQKEIKS